MLVVVIVAKEVLFRWLLRAGDSIGSSAVKNDALHHRSDVFTSLAAFVGILIALVKGPGYETADDWAALVACLVIAFNGARMLRTSLADSLDAAPPSEYEDRVRGLASEVEGVAEIEKCRVRKSGLGTFVELHVVVDGEASVREGHRIGHRVKDALLAADLGILDVAVHVEPSLAPDSSATSAS